MNKKDLAQELRERQIRAGYIPENIINLLSDDKIIDSYITCSQCGEKDITDDMLDLSIKRAKNTDNFFDIIDKIKKDI